MDPSPPHLQVEPNNPIFLLIPLGLILCPVGILALILFRKQVPESKLMTAIAILAILNLAIVGLALMSTVEVVTKLSSGGEDVSSE
jgi:uncharacterized membrane protein YhhN